MDYRENIEILKRQVAEHAYIIPISRHRNADGSMNIDQFKTNWEKHMQEFEQIKLWEKTPDFDGRDPLQKEPYLVFIPAEDQDAAKEKGTIIISHGGGFSIRTGGEGPNIALYFHNMGYNTAVLTYRLLPYSRMDCLADLQRAIRLLRARREELGISERVIVMGFSAGAMLSSNAATHFDGGHPQAEDPVERESSRPDAAVICYGAFTGVSFPLPFGMTPKDGLFGNDRREQLYLAPEKNITVDTPPFFIWQTLSDDGRYGLNLAKALNDAQVPYELHIFEGGVHGLGLADGENDLGSNVPHITHWAELTDEWLELHSAEED